jgi:hypothetical protein
MPKVKTQASNALGTPGIGPISGLPSGRIGDRAVDHLGQPALASKRHPGHGVVDVPFQPFQIVGEKLKAEILGHRVIGRRPMRAAGVLIGAKVEAHLFLPQVIAAVHIAQQRQLVADSAVQASSSGMVSNSMY